LISLSNIILEMTAKGATLQATVDRLCTEIEKMCPGVVCSVLTVDDQGLLHPLSAPTMPPSYGEALDGLAIGPEVGCCGRAACIGKPVVTQDIAGDARWAEFKDGALALGLQSCWSNPIFGEDGRIIGTFALYSPDKRGPSESELEIVDVCTRLCSIALERHERVLERERRANVDQLTCLGNRAAFNAAMEQLDCSCPGGWAILIVDLDNLKLVNDGFGHHAGDRLIEVAAGRMKAAAAPDQVFRIGGDEFAILVQEPASLGDLDGFATAVLEKLAEPLDFNGHTMPSQATIGGAVVRQGDRSPETVRRNADFALYHAKETGRGGFVRYWPGIDTRITHRIAAIRDVDAALQEGRIMAHYQPIVRLDTGRIVALEALCRLQMSSGGTLAAMAFREAMADIHIANEITRRMLEVVAHDIRAWQEMQIPIDHVGINVSLADFRGGQLEQQIALAHALHGLPLNNLVIEVSESTCLALRDQPLAETLEGLRKEGVRIALDNFGTGGGMLMPLESLPIDMVKIDGSLVGLPGRRNGSLAVIGGLLHAARELGIMVVAEGIENKEQAAQLAGFGCCMGQGYAFYRPLDREGVAEVFAAPPARKYGH